MSRSTRPEMPAGDNRHSAGTWLLLRGLTREAGHWGRFPQQLQAALPGARILAIDLPGNGTLHRHPSPTSIPEMVAACRGELAARGVTGPVHVVAMSLGAMVSVAWAAAYPEELCGCVLINSSLRGISPMRQRLQPRSWLSLLSVPLRRTAHGREAVVLRLTSRRAPPAALDEWAELARQRPVSTWNALRQLLAAARFQAPALPPAVPMLVLCGGRDALVSPECSLALARRWDLPVHLHPNAGHDLPLDDSAWVTNRIRDWAATLDPALPRPPHAD
ncbi:MAG: alpha/beta hydrolase [Zoogloea sp.]|uniref:alpha/beta fold hydrolase n=1 Tax=Zoogloea sp. TaxID=49181 RepID=UPI002637E0D4|nr:alpha/beta hydrolase [Zoogloea sp.]MDD3325571.1 alpha/beta hydrolase [Zoogloea sp.]